MWVYTTDLLKKMLHIDEHYARTSSPSLENYFFRHTSILPRIEDGVVFKMFTRALNRRQTLIVSIFKPYR